MIPQLETSASSPWSSIAPTTSHFVRAAYATQHLSQQPPAVAVMTRRGGLLVRLTSLVPAE
jgi:hypothetical protein